MTMASDKSEILDFLFDKECKAAEDNFRSTLFSNEINTQKHFKEELFSDELQMEWKTEPNDFNMEELLGSYLTEDDMVPREPLSGADASPNSCAPLTLKEEDFEPFRDLVSLPFEAVMESLDQGELEDASDSGHSTDTVTDAMLSPSSAAMSPDPRGDISIDTLDAISDVSSTSDLGSMGSVGSPQNGGQSHSFTPARMEFNSFPVQFENGGETKSVSVPSVPVSEKAPVFLTVPASTFSHTRTITALPLSSQKFSSSSSSSSTTTSSTLPSQFSTGQPSITTRSIKLELAHHPRIMKPVTTTSTHVATTPTTRSPILTKVRLDTSGTPSSSSSSPRLTTSTTSRTNSPQTIVVTQAGKGGPLLRNGTLLKAGAGRSILLPVNVNDLNQVRTIKIISASSAGASGRPGVSSGVRTLVSTVRPVSTLANGTTGNRTTFYTTSKGSDGRSLLKVTPTALVTPTTHSASDASRVSVSSSYNGDDGSDDETPLPNQELVLNDEERRLMRKEGLVLPSRYPLTKQEERDLKRIRRKIRNKISAQDSRKRKKEYVDGLEDRVKNCTEENQQLQKRIKTLEKQNESLVAQLKKLQSLVGGGIYANRSHNHTSTALMMLILSAALFVVPSLRSQEGKGENDVTRGNKMPSPGHSRSLLEARNSLNIQNMEGFPSSDEEEIDPLTFSHALSDHDYAPVAKKPHLDHTSNFFPPLSVDKTLSLENGDPPDTIGGFNGVAAMIGAMLDRLGSNWTDPGGSFGGALNRTPPHGDPERSSVVVNLPHGRRLRDDIELE